MKSVKAKEEDEFTVTSIRPQFKELLSWLMRNDQKKKRAGKDRPTGKGSSRSNAGTGERQNNSKEERHLD